MNDTHKQATTLSAQNLFNDINVDSSECGIPGMCAFINKMCNTHYINWGYIV